jgi:hypothetical protein
MNTKTITSRFALTSGLLLGMLAQLPVTGQETDHWTPDRTAWGDPNLQGVYTFSTLTPLERPETLRDQATYTAEELAEAELQSKIQPTVEESPIQGNEYNAFWTSNEKGRLVARTSLIVDPPNGRLPPLTEHGQQIYDERTAELASRQVGEEPLIYTLYDTWLDHPTYTRCLARPMPRVKQGYNHGLQILQTPGYVIIYYESMHDTRFIPLDGRPHIDSSIRQWNGDARGHWEGDTLVVDWRNFTDKQDFRSISLPQGNMRLVERITKVDENTIDYEVTVHDPTTWTQPWTLVAPWRADDPSFQNPEDLYEFACHEGNYRMMENSLNGSKTLRETYSVPK